MPKFRKKPVVIEARQFLGGIDHAREIVDWVRSNKHGANVLEIGPSTHAVLIWTLEGEHRAGFGDWII